MASVTRTAVKPLQGGVGYQLTAGEEWAPEAVSVEWDGTSAAGDFVVAVSYYNDGGALIDRAFPEGVTNVAGDTGRTFFRPFKRGSGGGGGADPNAVHYGVSGETGSFIDSRTDTGTLSFWDRAGAGLFLTSADPGNAGFIGIDSRDGTTFLHGDTIVLRNGFRIECQDGTGAQRLIIRAGGGTIQRLSVGQVHDVTDNFGNSVFTVYDTGAVFTALPNFDPGVSGQLWNNGGVVNVSP